MNEIARVPGNVDPSSKCIVRLTTSYWSDKSGIHMKKSLRYLRRKCGKYNILEEDVSNLGDIDVIFSHIINLDKCKDGVYRVVTCNESHHWETPDIIDDYDYELIPL